MQHTSHRNLPSRSLRPGAGPLAIGASLLALALAGAAVYNRRAARRAQEANPPRGQFINVDGVRLHYLDEGNGEPLVMLHGNGTSTDELAASGLIGEAARKYRVLAFDRPGFGHTERPSGPVWTAQRQADLIAAAMERLGAPSAIVFAHSWGVLVAMNLALKHPARVRALALEGGYYFPTMRADALLAAPSAMPVLGAFLSNVVSPFVAGAMWEKAVRNAFAPAPVAAKFRAYDPQMALRPSQLRASAEESALMIGEARALQDAYTGVRAPVVLLAGEGDRIADAERQSSELHRRLPESVLRIVRGAGHMVHQTNPVAALGAIDDAAAMAERKRRGAPVRDGAAALV